MVATKASDLTITKGGESVTMSAAEFRRAQAERKRREKADACEPVRSISATATMKPTEASPGFIADMTAAAYTLAEPEHDAHCELYRRFVDWQFMAYCWRLPFDARFREAFDDRAGDARSTIAADRRAAERRADLLGLTASTPKERKQAGKAADARKAKTQSGGGRVSIAVENPYSGRMEQREVQTTETLARLFGKGQITDRHVWAAVEFAELYHLVHVPGGSVDWTQDRVDTSRKPGGIPDAAVHAAAVLRRVRGELGRRTFDMVERVAVKGYTLTDLGKRLDRELGRRVQGDGVTQKSREMAGVVLRLGLRDLSAAFWGRAAGD